VGVCVRGMVLSGGQGDSGRALTRSPFSLCYEARELTTSNNVANPHLVYLFSHELLEFLGHYGSLW
jgi:hypothetical protein